MRVCFVNVCVHIYFLMISKTSPEKPKDINGLINIEANNTFFIEMTVRMSVF